MFHRTLPLFCLAFAQFATGNGFALHPAGTVAQEPALNAANFGNWQERLRAKESELVWQKLPWLTSFHEGLMQAASKQTHHAQEIFCSRPYELVIDLARPL